MYVANLKFPGSTNPAVLASALDALAVANAFWTLEQWSMGVDPPCCLECADIEWRPDSPSSAPSFIGGDELLKQGYASCGPIAAYEAGRKMAEMMRDGTSLEDATVAYGIMLVDDDGAYGVGGGGSPMDLVHRGTESTAQASFIPRGRQTRADAMPPNGYAVGSQQKNFQVNAYSPAGVRNPRRYGTASNYWHAVVRTPTGLWDPTEKMRVRR